MQSSQSENRINYQLQGERQSFLIHEEIQNSSRNHDILPFSEISQPIWAKPSFAPFIKNSMQFKGNFSLRFGSFPYNQKQHEIIAFPVAENAVHFYDATTLQPSHQINLNGPDVHVNAFDPETEVYLFGCTDGLVFSYNMSEKKPQTLAHPGRFTCALTFINSEYYAFSAHKSKCLFIGNLKNTDVWEDYSKYSDSLCLYSLKNSPLLLSFLRDNSFVLYRINQLPKLRIVYSIKAVSIKQIQSVTISQKEYIITTGKDDCRIWHFVKGKMRLLRVFHFGENLSNVVFLESEKMLAVICGGNEAKFYNFLSGRLECTLVLPSTFYEMHLFLMKEKNTLGIASNKGVQIIQLRSE